MLPSPRGCIIGSRSLGDAEAFYGALGFEVVSRGTVERDEARALYGVKATLDEMLLGVPGAPSGQIRLVSTPEPRAGITGPFDAGPYDISFYTRDIEAAAGIFGPLGCHVGPIGVVDLGFLVMRQRKVIAPDGVRVVLIETEKRRDSILDRDPDRMFSEAHSLVWAVSSIDEAAPFWREALTQAFDMPVAHPAVSEFLELPRPDVGLRMAGFADAAFSPMRLELMEFPTEPGAPARDDATLRPGLWAMEFQVDDIEAAASALAGAQYGKVCAAGVSAIAPGGVRFILAL